MVIEVEVEEVDLITAAEVEVEVDLTTAVEAEVEGEMTVDIDRTKFEAECGRKYYNNDPNLSQFHNFKRRNELCCWSLDNK